MARLKLRFVSEGEATRNRWEENAKLPLLSVISLIGLPFSKDSVDMQAPTRHMKAKMSKIQAILQNL